MATPKVLPPQSPLTEVAYRHGAAWQDRLRGSVEIDETYVGGSERGVRGRGTNRKFIIAIAIECFVSKGFGCVREDHVDDVSGASLASLSMLRWNQARRHAFGRTRHPFAISGLGGPSQMIEFVFSASPETKRRESRECDLLRAVGDRHDLAVCAFIHPVDLCPIYAAAVPRF